MHCSVGKPGTRSIPTATSGRALGRMHRCPAGRRSAAVYKTIMQWYLMVLCTVNQNINMSRCPLHLTVMWATLERTLADEPQPELTGR